MKRLRYSVLLYPRLRAILDLQEKEPPDGNLNAVWRNSRDRREKAERAASCKPGKMCTSKVPGSSRM